MSLRQKIIKVSPTHSAGRTPPLTASDVVAERARPYGPTERYIGTATEGRRT